MNKVIAIILLLLCDTCFAQSFNNCSSQFPSTFGNSACSANPYFTGGVYIGTPAISDTGVLGQATSSVAGYNQFILQNTNSANNASANLVINNNLGTFSTYYGEFGMNSSNFTGSGSFNLANAVYLDAQSGDLVLGTLTANKVHFEVNSSSTDAITIGTTGLVGIGSSSPATALQVTGATGSQTLMVGPYAGSGGGIIQLNSENSGSLVSQTIQATQTGGMEFKAGGAQGFSFATGSVVNPAGGAMVQINGNLAVGAGYAQLSTAGTNGMIVQGSTAIGTSSPAAGSPLTISGLTTGTNADFLCLASSGAVLVQTSACTISMRKLKDDIVEVSGDAAFNDLMALRPVSFKFKQTRPPNADPNFTKPQYGFIAEEVADVDPQITVYDNDGVTPKSWDERHVVPLLVKGFQIQQREIEAATGAFPFHKCLNWLPLLCSDK